MVLCALFQSVMLLLLLLLPTRSCHNAVVLGQTPGAG